MKTKIIFKIDSGERNTVKRLKFWLKTKKPTQVQTKKKKTAKPIKSVQLYNFKIKLKFLISGKEFIWNELQCCREKLKFVLS